MTGEIGRPDAGAPPVLAAVPHRINDRAEVACAAAGPAAADCLDTETEANTMETLMNDKDLHARLDALAHKIDATRTAMERKQHLFHDDQFLTADELKERHETLRRRLDREVADAESHGHHVSNLERSVRAWLDEIDAET